MADEKTQTWRSKKDPTKKLTVLLPFFGIAQLKGGGEIARDQLQTEYEPELPPATLQGADLRPTAPNDDRIDRIITHLGVLTQRVNDSAGKIDEMHAIVVPKPRK